MKIASMKNGAPGRMEAGLSRSDRLEGGLSGSGRITAGRMKWGLTGLCLASLLLATAAGCHKAAPGDEGRVGKQSAERSGGKKDAMWNGGKPQAPVTISSSLSGVIEANRDLPVILQIQPQRACTDLTVEVSGVDGVVVGGESVRHFDQCGTERAGRHDITVRVPPDVAGMLVVTVSFKIDGKPVSATKAFSMQAPGARAKKNGMGTPGTDADGNKVLILQSK